MGNVGWLDRILLIDFRFALVILVACVVYFRPIISRASVHGARSNSLLLHAYSISIRCERDPSLAGLAAALVMGLLFWMAAGLAPLLTMSIRWPLIHDAPIMHYIAWRVAHGAVPYRDILDMNLPGVYVIHMLVLTLFGDSDLGWRLFDLFWLAITNGFLWSLCYPKGRSWAVVALLSYSTFHLSSGAPGMGQRDYLEFLFLAAGAYLAVRALDMRLERRLLFASGIAFGCAMSIKPFAGMMWLAVAALAALQPAAGETNRLRVAGPVLAGGLVLPCILAAWLAAIGGLPSFISMAAGVLPIYSRLHDRPFVSYVAEYWPIWLPCVLTIPVSLLNGRAEHRRWILMLGVVYGALHYLVQAKGWLYQLYPLVGFSGALVATTIGEGLKASQRVVRIAVFALTSTFIVGIGTWGERFGQARALTADTSATVASLESDLSRRLHSGETVQSFDTTGGCIHALFRMKLALPTRYLGDYLIFTAADRPYLRRLRVTVMSDLRSRPPDLLVVYRWGWPTGQYDRLDRFPELRCWMSDNYRVDVTRTSYVIYRRRI